jgi:hypothetical protein
MFIGGRSRRSPMVLFRIRTHLSMVNEPIDSYREPFVRMKTDAIVCHPHCAGVLNAPEPMMCEVNAPSLALGVPADR